jgi:hypothetical protein
MSLDSRTAVKEAFLAAGARAFLPKELVQSCLVEVISR